MARNKPKDGLRIYICSLLDVTETPSIYQTLERMVIRILKTMWSNLIYKLLWRQYPPRSAVGHPADDMREPWIKRSKCE
jgi:hypothetical protein